MKNKSPSRRRSGFHSRFLILKKLLGVSLSSRKIQIDSLLKKCKSKCFKSIHSALKKCIKYKIERLPQKFITNIKIESNKNYMNKTILQIFQEFRSIDSLEKMLAKKRVKEGKTEMLKEFLNLTFREAFESYITSHLYLMDYENIKQKESKNFAILFNYISRIFVQYYTYSKGNNRKCLGRSRTRKNKIEKIEKIFEIRRNSENDEIAV